MSNLVNISPNVKVLESLRCVGYSNDAAVADLVDNSLDAEASNVRIFIEHPKDSYKIAIVDDGCGMSLPVLKEAMKLGSDTLHESTDLGKFGVGLVTASISMGRRIHVLTKSEDEVILSAIEDLDNMTGWEIPIKEASPEECEIYQSYLEKSTGTIVMVDRCDSITEKNITHWTDRLVKNLGRIFRLLLTPNTKIFINEKEISPIDPLEWNCDETEKEKEIFSVDLELTNGKKITGEIEIRCAKIAQFVADRELKPCIKWQGCYIIRNNREIISGDTLDLWVKHNAYNYLRMEIRVGSDLDEAFRLSFNKQRIDLMQSLANKIEEKTLPFIKTYLKQHNKETAAKSEPEVKGIGEEASEIIKKKPKGSLVMPKANTSNRQGMVKNPNGKGVKPTGKGGVHGGTNLGKKLADRCKFATRSFGAAGCMFEATKQGGQIVIEWNVDHPFYKEFIAATGESNARKFILGTHFFAFVLASAELTYTQDLGDQGSSMIENIHNFMSMNMRTLLS